MELGQQIRLARQQRGMTQAYLARLLNVQPMVIDGWEGAGGWPTTSQLMQLGEILGVAFTGSATQKVSQDAWS